MSALDIILIVIGCIWVVGAVAYIIYAKKHGKRSISCGGCNGDCAHCAEAQKKPKSK